MKVRIKKDVRPFGGRVLKVLSVRNGPDGVIYTLEAGPKRGTFGHHSDPREYREHEVTVIPHYRVHFDWGYSGIFRDDAHGEFDSLAKAKQNLVQRLQHELFDIRYKLREIRKLQTHQIEEA